MYKLRTFNCIKCNIEIVTRNLKFRQFCSSKCYYSFNKDKLIKEWQLGKDNGLKTGCRLKTKIRSYLFEKFENKCCKCGWNEINPYTKNQIPPLEVNHLDGDSSNNKEENLELICPNCHALTSTYKALNKGKANKERLAYSRMITMPNS